MYFKLLDTIALHKKIAEEKFPFSQNLFWDAAIENIDLKKNSRYVVERVVTRGFLEDFYVLLQIYTTETIITALKKSRELDSKTANFCSLYFKIPKKELHVSSFYG
jgi:hypothetical protein